MKNISVEVRLRPIRFAFLVRPNDRKRVLEIFRINTCLWGGKFNPIIPFFHQVPDWWDRHGSKFDSARQIINGYLDRFEPDFIVEAEKGLSAGLGFSKERVLQLAEILVRDGDNLREGYGLGTFDLYRDLYLSEYKFERRHKHDVTSVIAAQEFQAFAACAFGGFPQEKELNYFSRAFNDAFDPNEISLDGASLAGLYASGLTSAIEMGRSKIEVEYHDNSDPTLFVLNARDPRDLIDFWNLRTLQEDILAIPIQWISDLSGFCKKMIEKAHRPMRGNPYGLMLHARVLFSRSIKTEEIPEFYRQHFAVDTAGANVLQDWYPKIWHESPAYVRRSNRPTLTVLAKNFDLQYPEEKPDVRFDSLDPEFAPRFGGEIRWANVIKINEFGFENKVATAIPDEYRNSEFSPFFTGLDALLATREGLVVFPRFKGLSHFWRLVDGMSAISDWLKISKIESRHSDAGRATQQIIQTMKGFNGVQSFASEKIVKLLNEISRRPVTKSMEQHEFVNRVTAAVKGNLWIRGHAEKLIERNAVELGLELKCSKCASWSWYSLKQLDYVVRCGLCLRDFQFPVINPSAANSSRWAYRLIGPFALPDFANGGYAAALAIRFFAQIIEGFGTKVTWSAGQELSFPDGKKIEADFILWYRRTPMFGLDHPTEIVFGEAKSFGRAISTTSSKNTRTDVKEEVFREDDVARMKRLAESFPGAVLVFATMKEAGELTKKEIGRLRKLAEWGREYIKESRRTRAPLIVLTGTELFTGHSIRISWQKKGGKHAELNSPGYIELENLKTFADMTQQLYLDMPSYDEWFTAKRKARGVGRRSQT